MNRNRLLTIASLLLLLSAGSLSASTIALTGWSEGAAARAASDQLYGWYFDSAIDITITSLGVFDQGSDGLLIPHDVGIFRVSDQVLLVSGTVPGGVAGTLTSQFRYTSISPFALSAGSYVIVMTMPGDVNDWQMILASAPTTSAPVSYVDSAFGAGSGLSYPNAPPGLFAAGMFGPNFQFDVAEIPEPSTVLLVAAGLGLLAARRRR